DKGMPSNPMVNAGAIAVVSLVKGADGDERFARIREFARALAGGGRDPASGTRLVSAETVRIVLTLMFTTGMYQGSGRFSVDVGIPAKSGVSGALMAVAPGRMGFGL